MIHVEQHGPVLAIRMARGFLGRPLYWTAAYWVDGLLIDTGPRVTAAQLARVLEQVRVDRIVVTHSHEDHIGGLDLLHARYPQAAIYAPRRALPAIQDPSRLKMQLYRRVVWGKPRPLAAARSLDELDNVVRTPAYSLRVIETPGHSRDHVSFFEPNQRWLFCGDAFIGGQDRSWTREVDLFGVLSSLRTLASLRPERLFPGSGTVRRTPLPELHDKIGSLMRLAKEVARLNASGMSVEEMVVRLFKGETAFRWWTGGHFSSANLIEACRSYNALLAPDGLTGTGLKPARPVRPAAPDSPDSSANQSADRGDAVR
jgi:glyoxylase-like metal-dependent hydrolase (beta-lactamase superfamily II)